MTPPTVDTLMMSAHNTQLQGEGEDTSEEATPRSLVQKNKTWQIDKERRRKEKIGKLANDIMDAEAVKLIEEAYKRFSKDNLKENKTSLEASVKEISVRRGFGGRG